MRIMDRSSREAARSQAPCREVSIDFLRVPSRTARIKTLLISPARSSLIAVFMTLMFTKPYSIRLRAMITEIIKSKT
jgi:hypothetical protein